LTSSVGKINVYDSIVTETRKKKTKIWKLKKWSHKFPSKRWFRNGIHSLLEWADARESDDIIYRVWRISLLCGSGIVNDVTR